MGCDEPAFTWRHFVYIMQGEGPCLRLNTRTKQWVQFSPQAYCERWYGAVALGDDDYAYFAGGSNGTGDEVLWASRLKCSEDDTVTTQTDHEFNTILHPALGRMRLPFYDCCAQNGALVIPLDPTALRRAYFFAAGFAPCVFDMSEMTDTTSVAAATATAASAAAAVLQTNGWKQCLPDLDRSKMGFLTSACYL